MKISSIRVYQVDLPLVEGRYSWSEGKYVEVFDSTIVELVTDGGLSGFGEVCPLGPFYLPAFGAGARAGISELSGSLLGQDATAIGPMNQLMDRALLGHPYVKSAIDMACWDLLGKVCGRPVCDLLGGRFGDSVALYRAISQQPADEMAENADNMSEMLTLEGRVGAMKTNALSFYLWDAAVPALPIIAQLLLAAFLAIGGYRRYLRR